MEYSSRLWILVYHEQDTFNFLRRNELTGNALSVDELKAREFNFFSRHRKQKQILGMFFGAVRFSPTELKIQLAKPNGFHGFHGCGKSERCAAP